MTSGVGRKELRKFGVTVGTVIAILFGAVFPWLFGRPFRLWPWTVGGVLVAAALIFPSGLKPIYRGWMLLGQILNWINTRIILGFVFLIIIFPTAVIMRLAHRDPMVRTLEKARATYRVASANPSKNHFERPF
jgi:hypothetical protein